MYPSCSFSLLNATVLLNARWKLNCTYCNLVAQSIRGGAAGTIKGSKAVGRPGALGMSLSLVRE